MMFSFTGIDHKSFAEQRTRDADGHNFTLEERRAAPRHPIPIFDKDDDVLLDYIYRTMEAAQLSKRIGGHYLCAYRSAATFVDALIDRGHHNPRGTNGRVQLASVFKGTSLE
jgi:hypothetical protein